MADITFTIPLPVLQAGDSFKYRYRLVGGAYGGYTSVMTQTITITGLSAGNYELEITYVKADTTECAPVVKPFTVATPFSCYSISAVIVQSGLQYILRITYPIPSPLVHPSCGWRIIWGQGSVQNTIPYTTLPLSGFIDIVLPANANVTLQVLADICGDYTQVCFEDSVPKIASPNCIAAVFTSYDIVYTPPGVSCPAGCFGLRLMGTNSTPATPIYNFTWQETSVTNGALDSGTFSFPGGSAGGTFLYTLPINPQGQFLSIPNPNPDLPPEYLPNCISYVGNIVDICGNVIPFAVSGHWTPSGAVGGGGIFVPNGC